MRILVLLLALVASVASIPALAQPPEPIDWTEHVTCPGSAAQARSNPGLAHRTFRDGDLLVDVDALCDVIGDGDAPGTDCGRGSYDLAGWAWMAPVRARVDASNPSGLDPALVLAAFEDAAGAWDARTSWDLAAGFELAGKAREAGRYNGVSQFGFKKLGGGAIAVTTTWYSPTTHLAVESDAAYNSRLAWSLEGASGTFDLKAIATHELGHTWGLGDLYDPSDACLTMYGYAAPGDTRARTLGDGDVRGLQALYSW